MPNDKSIPNMLVQDEVTSKSRQLKRYEMKNIHDGAIIKIDEWSTVLAYLPIFATKICYESHR